MEAAPYAIKSLTSHEPAKHSRDSRMHTMDDLRWTQQGHLPLCEHLKVELEQTEGGDVSGTYRRWFPANTLLPLSHLSDLVSLLQCFDRPTHQVVGSRNYLLSEGV